MRTAKKVFVLCFALLFTLCFSVTAYASEITPVVFNDEHSVAQTDSESDYILWQFSEDSWSPAIGETVGTPLSHKAKAQVAGTLRIGIYALPRYGDGGNINIKVTSGLVTLVNLSVPADGQFRVYQFNGIDQKKVKIVKGNNYTMSITGPGGGLLYAIGGYFGVE